MGELFIMKLESKEIVSTCQYLFITFCSVPTRCGLNAKTLMMPGFGLLVSLVSVLGGNWCYLCGTVERVAECETVEITNVYAVFMHVAENMIAYEKRLGEYPTLSAIFSSVVSFS